MDRLIKNAIEKYQCAGCVCGSDIECFQPGVCLACSKHCAGTIVSFVGKVFLGMPKGFDRLGVDNNLKLRIYKFYENCGLIYNIWNIPVWKYLNKNGHTLVRGISPRVNQPFLQIFLEDCVDKIDCIELSQDDINGMN